MEKRIQSLHRVISLFLAIVMVLMTIPIVSVKAAHSISTPVVGILDPGDTSNVFTFQNNMFVGNDFGVTSNFYLITTNFVYVTVTAPNGYSYTNYANEAFLPHGQVIEGIPPESNPDVPDNNMQVMAVNDISAGIRGVLVVNPIFNDSINWTFTVTSATTIRASWLVGLRQPAYILIGNDLYGRSWHFNSESGTLTLYKNGVNNWGADRGDEFQREDIKTVVYNEDVTSVSSPLSNCINLTSVTFKTMTPPSVDSWFLHNTPALTTIYVPVGSKVSYQAVWWMSSDYDIVEYCVICGVENTCECPCDCGECDVCEPLCSECWNNAIVCPKCKWCNDCDDFEYCPKCGLCDVFCCECCWLCGRSGCSGDCCWICGVIDCPGCCFTCGKIYCPGCCWRCGEVECSRGMNCLEYKCMSCGGKTCAGSVGCPRYSCWWCGSKACAGYVGCPEYKCGDCGKGDCHGLTNCPEYRCLGCGKNDCPGDCCQWCYKRGCPSGMDCPEYKCDWCGAPDCFAECCWYCGRSKKICRGGMKCPEYACWWCSESQCPGYYYCNYILGDITGDGEIKIGDAIQILMFLAKIPSSILITDGPGSRAWKAALIVDPNSEEPSISDALQILMYIAKIGSSILYKN